MMKHKTVLPAYALMLFLSAVHANMPELRQLNVVFRHGDRFPETFPDRFPNDPNMYNSFYPWGSGGLTNDGKRRMYRLGEFLRNRYTEFLGTEYELCRLYGISSDLPRTKMSLQLVQSALYPPALSPNKWHKILNWQPIPTYFNEFRRDKFFNWDRSEICLKELARVHNLTEVKNKVKKYDGYMENLRLLVGKNSTIDFSDILLLHNNLDIEKRSSLPMEPWMIKILEDENLTKLRNLYYEITGYTDLLRRAQTGLILRKISDDMLKVREEQSTYAKKIRLYSGHDKTIIGLLQSLKLYDSHFPEFGSALIFELLSLDDDYFIKLFYYIGTTEQINDLMIPGCSNPCSLKDFIEITKSEQITNEELNSTINSDSYFGNNM